MTTELEYVDPSCVFLEARDFFINVQNMVTRDRHFGCNTGRGYDQSTLGARELAEVLARNSWRHEPDQEKEFPKMLANIIFHYGYGILDYLSSLGLVMNKDVVVKSVDSSLKSLLERTGYCRKEDVKDECRKDLLREPEETKQLMRYYYFGTRLMHSELYNFCAVAELWPPLCFHEKLPGYILNYIQFHFVFREGDGEQGIVRQNFENWVNRYRKIIVKNASDNLGFDWGDVRDKKG